MKLDFLSARLFSFCGPGMPKSEGYAMNDFFTKIISNQSITLNGNPGTIRSFMHPFDLTVKVIDLIIKKPSVGYLNIGSDNAQTIQFFAEEISKFVNSKVDVGADANDVSLKNYFPATNRLKQVTNTEDFFSTSTMLIDTYKYYQSQFS
jgi:nucleoside-diphosphate-sugar epimerase